MNYITYHVVAELCSESVAVILCEVPLSPTAAAIEDYKEMVALAVMTSYAMGLIFVTCAEVESATPNLIVVIFGLVLFAGIFFHQRTVAPRMDLEAVALLKAMSRVIRYHSTAIRQCNEALIIANALAAAASINCGGPSGRSRWLRQTWRRASSPSSVSLKMTMRWRHSRRG